MTRMFRWAAAALAAAVAAPPLGAQHRSVVLGGYVGEYSHLVNFNASGTADFRPSYDVGATLGVALTSHVGIHADITYNRGHARGPTSFGGTDFNRLFYGLHLELRYPVAPFTPFVFAGGGAMTVDQAGSWGSIGPFTKLAATCGGGLGYQLPQSRAEVFGEVKSLIYRWDRGLIYQGTTGGMFTTQGIRTTLVDVSAAVGLSYRFGP